MLLKVCSLTWLHLPYMVTRRKMEAVLNEPYICLPIRKFQQLMTCCHFRKVVQTGKALLIIAEDIEGEALATLVSISPGA